LAGGDADDNLADGVGVRAIVFVTVGEDGHAVGDDAKVGVEFMKFPALFLLRGARGDAVSEMGDERLGELSLEGLNGATGVG
jgi:hypothetical protein